MRFFDEARRRAFNAAPENSHGRRITVGGKFHDRRGERGDLGGCPLTVVEPLQKKIRMRNLVKFQHRRQQRGWFFAPVDHSHRRHQRVMGQTESRTTVIHEPGPTAAVEVIPLWIAPEAAAAGPGNESQAGFTVKSTGQRIVKVVFHLDSTHRGNPPGFGGRRHSSHIRSGPHGSQAQKGRLDGRKSDACIGEGCAGGQPQVLCGHILPHVVEIRGIGLTKTDHIAGAQQEHGTGARSPAVNPQKKSVLSGAGE